MGVPRDQELRQQQFIRDHPVWSIYAQDGASRFTAKKDDGTNPGRGMPLVQAWTQRLAAGGFGVRSSRWRDRYELIILNVPGGRSSLTVTGDGYARWYYEPRASPASPATLAGIIVQILGAPRTVGTAPGTAAYRAFPLKGVVGRCLQDRGLTVALRVCEDLESFEATTAIEVTSPARPWLGAVQLTDDGHLEWECDYRAAFHGDPGQLADAIAPILRASPGPRGHGHDGGG